MDARGISVLLAVILVVGLGCGRDDEPQDSDDLAAIGVNAIQVVLEEVDAGGEGNVPELESATVIRVTWDEAWERIGSAPPTEITPPEGLVWVVGVHGEFIRVDGVGADLTSGTLYRVFDFAGTKVIAGAFKPDF